MPKLRRILHQDGTFWAYAFLCPGCNDFHIVTVAETVSPTQIPRWDFNDNIDAPTFHPSIKVNWNEGEIAKCCHSHIRDGNIIFCGDCTHSLAGQTVSLPDAKEPT